MRVEITPEAQVRMVGVVDEFGMTQVAAMSRVIEWMAAQDELTQAMVLGVYPGRDRSTAAERAMKKIAKG